MAKDAGKVSKNAKTQKDAAATAASKAYVKVIVAEKSEKNRRVRVQREDGPQRQSERIPRR
jgi:hypothetical protein